MNRRNFIKSVPAAGIAVSALTLPGCDQPVPGNVKEEQDVSHGIFKDEFDLNEYTIDMLQEKMQQSALTALGITEKYLARIAAIDKSGPAINAVIELNPDAKKIASEMDSERKSGKVRGPMHGIPVLLKDNINTGDKMMTTAGSLALEGHHAVHDAFIIQKLRDSGAIILGKTNLSEWANFRSTRSASGWSSRGGQTKNPYMLDRNPCGSSSGSAAAVAANLCTVAIGTETDGSITAPASFCGITGLKPTVGLLSRTGIIPISATQDTAGPMARTVRDLAILLSVLTGTDDDDPVTYGSSNKSHSDYTKFLDAGSLKGKRIGIEKSFLKGHESVVAMLNESIGILKKAGAEIVEVELLKSIKELGEAELLVLQYEFKDGLNRYLSGSNASVKSLKEVISFNKQHEIKVMPWFKQEIMEISESKGNLQSKEYLEAKKKSGSAAQIIDDLMSHHKLDAIAGTTIGLPNCIDLINGDYDTGFYFGSPAAMAGYPHITIPMGRIHELPVGFSFMAGAFSEPLLLGLAYAFEQLVKQRSSPRFLAGLKLNA
jgi:amidase